MNDIDTSLQQAVASFDAATQALQDARSAFEQEQLPAYTDKLATLARLQSKIDSNSQERERHQRTFSTLFAADGHERTARVNDALSQKVGAELIDTELRHALADVQHDIDTQLHESAGGAARAYRSAYGRAQLAYAHLELARALAEHGPAVVRALGLVADANAAREPWHRGDSDDTTEAVAGWLGQRLTRMAAADDRAQRAQQVTAAIGALDLGELEAAQHISPAVVYQWRHRREAEQGQASGV